MIEPSKSIVDDKNVRPFISPRQKKQRRITVLIVVIVIAMAAGAYYLISPKEEVYTISTFDSAYVRSGEFQQTTQASGAISIPSQIEVRSPETGYAKAIYVSEGDYVESGAIIAEIDVPDLVESLSDLRDDYETDLLNYEKSKIQDEIAIAKTDRVIRGIESDIEDALVEVEKKAGLVEVNASYRTELDSAEEQLANLVDQLEEAKIGLADDLRLIEIDTKIQDANLDRTLREIDRLEERITNSSIVNPMSGEILEIEAAITVPGTNIAANQSLIIIANPESAVAELEILEQFAAEIAVGDYVELTISNTKILGEITQVGRVAQTSSTGLGATVAVRVRPIDPPIALLAGSTAVGTFALGEASDTLLLPRGPYLTTGSQRYVYVIDGNEATRRTVTFGQVEGNDVEILSGLDEGDEVITSGYQNFIEYETVRIQQGE